MLFSTLNKNLKRDFIGFRKIKLALLGDSATQFLTQALRGLGYEYGIDLDIFEADFNQIELQIFDPTSELYQFQPEYVVIFKSSHKLLGKYNKIDVSIQNQLATNELGNIDSLVKEINSKLKTNIIFYNYQEIDDAIFGNFSNKTSASFLYQLRKLNYELMNFAINNQNFHLCDLSSIQNTIGKKSLFHTSIYVNSEMVLSIEVLPLVVEKTFKIILALQGKIKKCVILDLDNTTWGGVIGDDGIEHIQIGTLGIGKAFSEFQAWIKKLKQRGILVAVCSKNTESVAKVPFEKHPEMVLRLDDIAVFVANWENKVDNIRHIQGILNIGFDSMVFLDDNPFERNMVRQNIPEITVPELPDDPAEYLEYLYELQLFETVSFSNEDLERTKLYQIEAQRAVLQQTFTNEADFLANLAMVSVIEPFHSFNTPRVAQLSQRSNQFNLRTIRYSEIDIVNLSTSQDFYTFSFTLKDKFGDNGMICAVVLKKHNHEALFIENWFMSCRVLKRGMEQFTLNTLAAFAKAKGFNFLFGQFIPTNKNQMVQHHYQNLGFHFLEDFWQLDLNQFIPHKTFIHGDTRLHELC